MKIARPQRRRFLIDPVQRRLLLVNLLYFLVIAVVFAAVVFVPVMVELQSDVSSWNERLEAANVFLSLHTRLWPALILLFFVLGVHFAVVTHRVAGPLYRFRQIFDAIERGDLSIRVAIRKRDYLAKEADSINRMIAGLRERVGPIQEITGKICASARELKKAVGGESVESLADIALALESQASLMESAVGRFKTGTDMRVDEGGAHPSVSSETAAQAPQR